MAERNKPVKIYLVYSEKDKLSKTARQNIREITAYLTKRDENNALYAEILNPLPKSGEKKRKRDAKKNLKRANVVLFLSGENAKDNAGEKNTIWEIKFARNIGCNIIVCSLDRNREAKVPDWLNKLDNKAKPLAWEDLKEKAKLHVEKKYKVFLDIAGNPSAEPCIDNISSKMIEQYQTYMHSIEHQENARQSANNAYITANSAFLALLGVIIDKENIASLKNILFIFVVSIVGFIFYWAWTRTLKYYEQINTAKQRLVNHLERYLPLQLNRTEYYDAMQSPFEKRYKRFKESQALPNAFLAVWIGLPILAFVVFLWSTIHSPDTSYIPEIIIKIMS